jgi:hypothetical protein
MKKLNLTTLTALSLVASAASALAGAPEPPVAVPEAGQTIVMLAVALIGLAAWSYKAGKKI